MSEEEKFISVQEAGRRGGNKTKQKGLPFYQAIGHLGGRECKRNHDSDYYKKIGKQGADKLKENRPPEYFKELSHKAGSAVMAKYGREHFVEMARKAVLAKAKKKYERDHRPAM